MVTNVVKPENIKLFPVSAFGESEILPSGEEVPLGETMHPPPVVPPGRSVRLACRTQGPAGCSGIRDGVGPVLVVPLVLAVARRPEPEACGSNGGSFQRLLVEIPPRCIAAPRVDRRAPDGEEAAWGIKPV